MDILLFTALVVMIVLWARAWRALRHESVKRRALEEANRQLRHTADARKEFMDMVAHQLRTPLGGIRSSVSMLMKGDMGELPPRASSALLRIEEVATRLLTLVETFLDASRVETGVYKGHRQKTDVKAEVSAVVSELLPYATDKGLTIEHHESDAFDECVFLDKEVLRNTLFNLMDNAIKYTGQGRIAVRCRDIEGHKIAVDVSDSGMGLTKEDIAQLFEKFQRVKGRRQEGLGLGLYVVKRLVDACGGSIAVTSDGPDKGSVFSFELPYMACVDGAKAGR